MLPGKNVWLMTNVTLMAKVSNSIMSCIIHLTIWAGFMQQQLPSKPSPQTQTLPQKKKKISVTQFVVSWHANIQLFRGKALPEHSVIT